MRQDVLIMTMRLRRVHLGSALGLSLASLLVLIGLFAMHGLAPTGDTGTHRPPAAVGIARSAVPADHGAGTAMTGMRSPQVSQADQDRSGSPGHGEHGLMVGCLVVLTGAVVVLLGLALWRCIRTPSRPRTSRPRAPAAPCPAQGRPPPQLLLLSLCVIRV
jgi:hypothetical protein